MRLIALTAFLFGSSAFAQNRVVGGSEAEPGAWPDAAGIVLNGQYVSCTGTLIAPNVVLTADHCVDPRYIGGARVTQVLLNETNWVSGDDGIAVDVDEVIRHDRADIAILVLAEDAPIKPRAVADGCIIDEFLEDGAPVSIVGYGLTNPNSQFNTRLHEGITSVVDADCSTSWRGCNTRLPEGSELYAGGDGVDACSGDSGGPLYLLTPLGDYLVGVTSRGPEGCRLGAIWVRPDAFMDWIEDETGVDIPEPTCNEPPTATDLNMEVAQGKRERVDIQANDPEGDEVFTYTILQAPEHGTVSIDDDGQITYTADDDYLGTDEFWVNVEDTTGFPLQRTNFQVDVDVVERGFLGCSATGVPASALWLIGFGGLLIRRRR